MPGRGRNGLRPLPWTEDDSARGKYRPDAAMPPPPAATSRGIGMPWLSSWIRNNSVHFSSPHVHQSTLNYFGTVSDFLIFTWNYLELRACLLSLKLILGLLEDSISIISNSSGYSGSSFIKFSLHYKKEKNIDASGFQDYKTNFSNGLCKWNCYLENESGPSSSAPSAAIVSRIVQSAHFL